MVLISCFLVWLVWWIVCFRMRCLFGGSRLIVLSFSLVWILVLVCIVSLIFCCGVSSGNWLIFCRYMCIGFEMWISLLLERVVLVRVLLLFLWMVIFVLWRVMNIELNLLVGVFMFLSSWSIFDMMRNLCCLLWVVSLL